MSEATDERYAILRCEAVELDVIRTAEVLAPILGRVRADLQRDLAVQPGILASDVAHAVALHAAADLRRDGVPVLIVPQADVVEAPPLIEVRRAQVTAEGFLFHHRGAATLAPWEEIVYFDAVQVQTSETTVAADRQMVEAGEGGVAWRDVARLKLETAWRELIDVVCYEPWVRLQIDKETFRFGAAGLARHPSRAKSFLALAIAFKTRCDPASEGPGMQLLFDGNPQTRQRVGSMRAYESLLRWRLTLRFRGE